MSEKNKKMARDIIKQNIDIEMLERIIAEILDSKDRECSKPS